MFDNMATVKLTVKATCNLLDKKPYGNVLINSFGWSMLTMLSFGNHNIYDMETLLHYINFVYK